MPLEDPSKDAKLVRLVRAQDKFKPLLEDSRQWENECEAVFSEFRVAVVHLRRDTQELDAVQEKEVVWRFLCKLSRERRPFWGRCEEVLRTLMNSDVWMKAFVADPETSLNDLPTNVVKEFGARVEEVGGAQTPHVRLAIIGCGAVAARHCALIARYNEHVGSSFYRIVALCDPVPARFAALRELPEAASLGLSEAAEVPSMEALFDKVEFDAVAFLSHAHRDGVITELFSRKKFVIVEPPLVPNVEAAAKLVRLSRQQEPQLQRLLVAEGGEYWPEVLAAREGISAGALGEVAAAQAWAPAAGPEVPEALSEGVGCSWAPGLRWVRALRRLLGPVEEVCGVKRELAVALKSVDPAPTLEAPSPSQKDRGRRSKLSPETYAAGLLRHEGGAVSSLAMQLCVGCERPRASPRLLVSGTQGEVVVVEDTVPVKGNASPGGASSAASSFTAPRRPGKAGSEGLVGDERIWELFARQLLPAARNMVSPPPEPTEIPGEQRENLDAHLADLAVVQALQTSFASRRFETVERSPA